MVLPAQCGLLNKVTAMKPYPAESYRRMYDPSVGELWTLENRLPLDEDADHYSPARDFFEWWYFDAIFDNGYRLVAILHSSLYNAVDHKPTVDIRVTPAQGDSILAIGRYPRRSYQASTQHCDVQIENCRAVREESGRYRLTLQQGQVRADLLYEPQAPAWRPGNGYLFFDDVSGHFFRWVVPVPLARVTGVLWIGDERLTVTGTGYHDHNWGNFVLADAFSHWYWGRFQASSGGQTWSLVFGNVAGRGPEPEYVRPYFLIGGGTIYDDNPKLLIQSILPVKEPRTGVVYPSRLELEACSETLKAVLSLESGEAMEALDFANPVFRRRLPRQLAEIAFYLSYDKPLLGFLARRLFGKASYLRLQAKATLQVERPLSACLEGEAIYEIMQF
jgi:predicted secreted hydrolase